MKLLPNITIRVPPVHGPVGGSTSVTTGGGGAELCAVLIPVHSRKHESALEGEQHGGNDRKRTRIYACAFLFLVQILCVGKDLDGI